MQTVNLILLTLHNLTRWLVLILALLVIIRAFSWLDRQKNLSGPRSSFLNDVYQHF